MTELVPTSEIEAKVGARRHPTLHLDRAVSAEQTVYILHSQECLDSGICEAAHLFINPGDVPKIHAGGGVCDRCIAGLPAHEPTPDTVEWIRHQLHDPTWARWRAEQRTSTLAEMVERSKAES